MFFELNMETNGTYFGNFQAETPVRNIAPFYQFMGVYAIGFLSVLSGAILYFLYIFWTQTSMSLKHFTFMCVASAFHWLPATLAAYVAIIREVPANPLIFALHLSLGYMSHGLILSLLTAISSRLLTGKQGTKQTHLRIWLHHRITITCHLRFAKLLSGTEAFCVYLRLLGAKIGRHCSIRAINPVSDPELISIGDGVHLGDFSCIVPRFYSSAGFTYGNIKISKNSIVGSQSLVLPGSLIQDDVILGALSIAPEHSVLQRGGIYVGSETPTMIKNMFISDERIDEMDPTYKKILGNLAGNLAITTMKVNSRYFHRIGVGGSGILKIYGNLPGFPGHKIFTEGKCYNVIVRHSNSLSADDDARIDARGAALRILSEESSKPLLDLTLKTGKAFYARTIADFATWLVCGLAAREQKVKRAPHIRDAIWGSLRNADSYAELHYYSNFCRLLRFDDGKEMYVKFKLRPLDSRINEDSGKVEPKGLLPPETGAIPREEDDTRPLLFLADDFRRRVDSPDRVCYIFQLQLRPTSDQEVALDCTRPWDESQFPYIDVGEIIIDKNLSAEESEQLEFNPFLRCPEVDIIRATSSNQSASIDHGRSLVYEICQHIRNGVPLPASWRAFLEQSDAKIDLSGCPMAAASLKENSYSSRELTLARTWPQTIWAALCQPLLQTLVPYFVLGLVTFVPLKWMLALNRQKDLPLHWMMPAFWVCSGIIASVVCVAAKWILVGRKKEGDTSQLWSFGVFMDTVWQALRTVVGEFFMEMTCGSLIFVLWMKLMGAKVEVGDGVYIDSMRALLNPEMVSIERGGCVGRDAILFGHIYEGEGKVKYGEINIEEGGIVGSRAVVMPGVRVESGGSLDALSLAMKGEIVH